MYFHSIFHEEEGEGLDIGSIRMGGGGGGGGIG